MDYDIPMSIAQCRAKLREEFVKHSNVTDVRVIDMLVIKVCKSYVLKKGSQSKGLNGGSMMC